jgi:hypothetical protein
MATRNPRKPSSVKLTPTYGYHFVAKTYTPTGALSKATTAEPRTRWASGETK